MDDLLRNGHGQIQQLVPGLLEHVLPGLLGLFEKFLHLAGLLLEVLLHLALSLHAGLLYALGIALTVSVVVGLLPDAQSLFLHIPPVLLQHGFGFPTGGGHNFVGLHLGKGDDRSGVGLLLIFLRLRRLTVAVVVPDGWFFFRFRIGFHWNVLYLGKDVLIHRPFIIGPPEALENIRQ